MIFLDRSETEALADNGSTGPHVDEISGTKPPAPNHRSHHIDALTRAAILFTALLQLQDSYIQALHY